ncbi:helix-turn-helix transcriptional regulator [Streptomyces coelicoflavus]|uniref:helix-turn-helix transcriptional regulator n=1 Tax=Streptomyces coelicoflavus TaxID=285562 RepID=UPI00365E248D
MVDSPPGETYEQIAARHGRSLARVRNAWARHPAWPAPTGKRGKQLLFDPADVDRAIREHIDRPTAALEPDRLYTAKEIEQRTGITAATIRADRHKDRWPAPDDTANRAHRWKGSTVAQALTGRRAYRKGQEG